MKPLSILVFRWCPEGDLNPHALLGAADFKSAASADSAIQALPYPSRTLLRLAPSGGGARATFA